MKLIVTVPRIRKNFLSLSLIASLFNFTLTFIVEWIVPGLSNIFRFYAVVPLLYTLFFAAIRRFSDFTNPGAFTVHLVAFLRYLISPFIMITTKRFSSMCHAFENMNKAILLMIVEMIFIFATLFIYNPKTKEIPKSEIQYPSLVKIAAVVTFIFFLIDNASLIGNLSIFSGKVRVANTNSTLGIVSIIWQALCVFIFCFITLGIILGSDEWVR